MSALDFSENKNQFNTTYKMFFVAERKAAVLLFVALR